MIDIDASGKPCPQPVIEVKKSIDKYPGELIKIIVDNPAAVENISRFAEGRSYKVETTRLGQDRTEMLLRPAASEIKSSILNTQGKGKIFFMRTYGIGGPDEQLSGLLAKTMFQTMAELEDLPEALILMNGAVKHSVKNSATIKELKNIEKKGVDILVCGTCLDYFGLKDEIEAGRISNFFEILGMLGASANTVTL